MLQLPSAHARVALAYTLHQFDNELVFGGLLHLPLPRLAMGLSADAKPVAASLFADLL